MGFFSDLKEDLSQAVSELMPEEVLQKKNQQEPVVDAATTQDAAVGDTQARVSLEEMLKNIDSIQFPEGTATSTEDRTQESVEVPIAHQETADVQENVTVQEPVKEIPVVQEEKTQESKEAGRIMNSFESKTATGETSATTAGMTITGDITSEGSIDLIGTIVGNIDVLGKLNITGHITGNSKASEIYAESAKINGEVVSEGAVKIGASSVIIGNITATSAVIAGAVKGDIDVRGPVVLDSSAIVMGNIKSKSVQINNGAVIEGMCSQCYADVSPASFFDEYKPEPKKAK